MAGNPGRPRATDPRNVRVTVRFTEAEMRAIEACLMTQESYATFIRRCVKASFGGTIRSPHREVG